VVTLPRTRLTPAIGILLTSTAGVLGSGCSGSSGSGDPTGPGNPRLLVPGVLEVTISATGVDIPFTFNIRLDSDRSEFVPTGFTFVFETCLQPITSSPSRSRRTVRSQVSR
jgi:hypothetical protein